MPDYEVRLTVHASDLLDAHEILSDIILPPEVELLSTSLLGEYLDNEERITKTTFLYTVMHRRDDEVEEIEDAFSLVEEERALAGGTPISSVGVPYEDVEEELIALGDEGDFFS